MIPKIKPELLRDIYLVVFTGVITLLMFNVVAPFATTLLIALLLVALFQPIYKRIEKRTNRSIASAISTIIVLLVVVVPVAILTIVIANEVSGLTAKATAFVKDNIVGNGKELKFLDQINSIIVKINPDAVLTSENVWSTLNTLISNLGGVVSGIVLSIFRDLGALFGHLVVFIFALVLIFRDYERIPRVFKRYLPLSSDLEDTILTEFITTGKSVIKGIFLVSTFHAIGVTIVFYLFGVQALGVFFFLLFIASMVPGGSQFIWIPVSIAVGITSGWGVAVLMLILCLIIMNMIDTLVRPIFASGGNTKIHPLLSLISILGGLIVYGASGLLYGPLIAVLFVTLIGAYNQRFKDNISVAK